MTSGGVLPTPPETNDPPPAPNASDCRECDWYACVNSSCAGPDSVKSLVNVGVCNSSKVVSRSHDETAARIRYHITEIRKSVANRFSRDEPRVNTERPRVCWNSTAWQDFPHGAFVSERTFPSTCPRCRSTPQNKYVSKKRHSLPGASALDSFCCVAD